MADRNPQPHKTSKKRFLPESGDQGRFSRCRLAQPAASSADAPESSGEHRGQKPSRPDGHGPAKRFPPATSPGVKSGTTASKRKPTVGRSPDEKVYPDTPPSQRRRLPDLETVLDAFDPMDESLEPEPEPGDFWIEPDDWETP